MESLKLLILKLMTNTYYFLFISVTGRVARLKSKETQTRRTVFVLFFLNIKFSYLIGNIIKCKKISHTFVILLVEN